LEATEQPLKIATPEVMQRIKDVIRDTATPSWLGSVPYNFGDAAAGKLKADEWRTMFTLYLPIALVSLWGKGTSHPSTRVATRLKDILDHTMSLVSAIILACMRTTTRDRAEAYRICVATWVQGLKRHYPHIDDRTNNHMAFHIYDFLLLFGPVHSWWCFPFERLIGKLQRLPTNHKYGKLPIMY
jgi:nitrate reductase gamma subunit